MHFDAERDVCTFNVGANERGGLQNGQWLRQTKSVVCTMWNIFATAPFVHPQIHNSPCARSNVPLPVEN